MAIVFDAASDTDVADTDSPHTMAHTVTSSGSNGYLAVGMEAHTTSVTGVKYAGDSMTRLEASTDWDPNNVNDLEYWYLLSPTAGTNNVEVSFTESGANGHTLIGAISLTGVDQNNPHGTTAKTTDTGTAISVDVTSQEGDLVLDLFACTNLDRSATPGGGQTERFDVDQNTGVAGSDDHTQAGSTEGGAPTVTMSWSITSATGEDLALIAVPVRPASGGRQLSTRYHINSGVNRDKGRTIVIDTLGRQVPLEQLQTDEWVHQGGAFFPTTRRFPNLVVDRARGYIESVTTRDVNTPNPRSRIAVRKESQLDFIMRRLTRGSV